ncbi:uncharacterized protein LOC6740201 [Drosophila simulans]|uniref:GD24855 n=1 Tax=Drosophila simulans TaxID=7240 RepID=B4NUM8_DROSI|nr:uncharacterized protein LOC6740201 [Drosophila simulans]EDX16675.1 GD24855 [Drosophila simulans]KMZ10530.1 uncharacterized protein Dsimw501_GD24855 [Drosophila simulans]
MSQVGQLHPKSPPATAGAGAGSPQAAASVAVAADANETELMVKVIMDMGYPEGEARLALAQSNNNVQRAVQILVEGMDDGESRKRRGNRMRLRQLSSSLMGNPLATDEAIVQMMRDQRIAQALAELVNGSSVQAMELLLTEEEDEPEDEMSEEEQLETSQEQSSSSADGSSPSN